MESGVYIPQDMHTVLVEEYDIATSEVDRVCCAQAGNWLL